MALAGIRVTNDATCRLNNRNWSLAYSDDSFAGRATNNGPDACGSLTRNRLEASLRHMVAEQEIIDTHWRAGPKYSRLRTCTLPKLSPPP